MIVKINQQMELESHPDASEKFYIYIGEDYSAEYLGLDGRFHNRMGDGYGHYFDTREEAEEFAEDLGHVVDKECCVF